MSTRPVRSPREAATARFSRASPCWLRPVQARAAPSVACTSTSRSGRPDARASRMPFFSSAIASGRLPRSRRTIPIAWCASEASYALGRPASTERAAISASCGRDTASGSSRAGSRPHALCIRISRFHLR